MSCNGHNLQIALSKKPDTLHSSAFMSYCLYPVINCGAFGHVKYIETVDGTIGVIITHNNTFDLHP